MATLELSTSSWFRTRGATIIFRLVATGITFDNSACHNSWVTRPIHHTSQPPLLAAAAPSHELWPRVVDYVVIDSYCRITHDYLIGTAAEHDVGIPSTDTWITYQLCSMLHIHHRHLNLPSTLPLLSISSRPVCVFYLKASLFLCVCKIAFLRTSLVADGSIFRPVSSNLSTVSTCNWLL